jgi:tetratricopeptide (TPR) repeat protein
MDAQTLFRQGVLAIRDENDPERGRTLLTQALKLDPNNDMAWLWLTRTTSDPQARLEYVERALRINPANAHAQKLKQRLTSQAAPATASAPSPPRAVVASESGSVIRPLTHAVAPSPSSTARAQINALLQKADDAHRRGNIQAALDGWRAVLDIQVDNEIAVQRMVSQLWWMQRAEDAWNVVWRALEYGTTVPTIWLTALDIAERLQDQQQANFLRQKIVETPEIDDSRIVALLDRYLGNFQVSIARDFAHMAGRARPDSQVILLKVGDVMQQVGQEADAKLYLSRATELGRHTKAGKQADDLLLEYVPTLTYAERSSVWLAIRETLGIGALYLMLAWQDAGLDLLHLGIGRCAGIALALVGGYLLVTATSSPDNRLMRNLMPRSKRIPPNTIMQLDGTPAPQSDDLAPHEPVLSPGVRIMLGSMGSVALVVAFVIVFQRALELAF